MQRQVGAAGAARHVASPAKCRRPAATPQQLGDDGNDLLFTRLFNLPTPDADTVKFERSNIRENAMTDKPTPPRPFADIAPGLADYTEQVLFGDMWKRPGLSPRDRSLITVATLVALYRTNELPFHLKRALDNGVTQEELGELITHLAFYSGWPTAATAVGIARQVFAEVEK
jgi:4-carboxymuconolactone decarboxylase